MTTFTDLPARPSSRDLQPRVRFGSSLTGSGLNAFGAVGDSELRDKPEQFNVLPRGQCRQGLRGPGRPDLHCMLETQLPRLNTGAMGCLCHEHTNQVVSEQIDPQLLFNHLGTLATECLHTQGRLDATQVQLSGKGLARYRVGSRSVSSPSP